MAANHHEGLDPVSDHGRVDLRSDLLSRPSAAMIEAMARAAARPASFDLREDPVQRELEAFTAELLGQEDALLCPTCTMANEIGLALLAGPGDAVATQPEAHVITSEAGAPAALFGITVEALTGGPMPALDLWQGAASRIADAVRPKTGAFSLENTHNRAGGVPLPLDYIGEVAAIARRHGVGLHLDGARLFNAAFALGVEARAYGRLFDTVSLSLNKGLGAPIGAIIAGSRARIERALVLRHRLGGGLRPTGAVAAAALCAVRDREHIPDDHRRARRFVDALGGATQADAVRVHTNLAVLQVAPPRAPQAICAELARRGVLALPFGDREVRFAFYRGLSDADVDRAAQTVREVLAAGPQTGGRPLEAHA